RVEQLAGEAPAAGPVGDVRRAVVAGRDDRLRGEDRPPRRVEPPARFVRLDPLDPSAGAHLEAVLLDVGAEVLEQVVTGHPPAEPARNAEAGQTGEQARRVEAEPVVPCPPGCARLRARLEHERLEAAPAQERRGGEAG